MSIETLSKQQKKFIGITTIISSFIAGLCCFSPVVLVLFGFTSVSYAIALNDVLYFQYDWIFLLAGTLTILISLIYFFYFKEKVCSISELKRKKKMVINLVLITFFTSFLVYIFWLYGIVEIMGIFLGIW
jgi:hypothetical protein